ncbi:MAG: hypothetical protein LBD35_04060 [Prevotellaceae bacterium]|jgi:hypothetical protein|nr:hypothetical protein [Prevotellaceae bacterium]
MPESRFGHRRRKQLEMPQTVSVPFFAAGVYNPATCFAIEIHKLAVEFVK